MDEDVVERFAKIKWCDLSLISMKIEREKEFDNFVAEIVGLYSEIGTKFELRFVDATYLCLDVDVAFKRCSADAIDGARCRSESPWKKSLADLYPYDNFSSYWHFEIGLVPKGGTINILAKDFTIQKV